MSAQFSLVVDRESNVLSSVSVVTVRMNPRVLALLSELKAAHPKGVRYSELVRRVFGANPPVDCASAMRQHIHRARTALRAVGGYEIETDCGSYRLRRTHGTGPS